MPGRHRISGEQAMLFIRRIRERLCVVALNANEYGDALESSAALGIVGGSVYDAMLAHCAPSNPSIKDALNAFRVSPLGRVNLSR